METQKGLSEWADTDFEASFGIPQFKLPSFLLLSGRWFNPLLKESVHNVYIMDRLPYKTHFAYRFGTKREQMQGLPAK
jgi:hypothetical protein